MLRSTALFAAIFLILISIQQSWAQLTPDQEKRLQDLEAKEKILRDWEKDRPQIEQRLSVQGSSGITQRTDIKRPTEFNAPISNGSVGRYQAVKVESNAVFILDTLEGHLWIWVIQKDKQGQPIQLLFYQGQVVPGSYMGELIDSTVNKGR